jgi:Acyltransferase family
VRRLSHLDALRSGAMLVVVVWHVTVIWPFAVPLSRSTTSLLEWPLTLSRWSLPLFFTMAGFLGAALYERWGLKRFARDRLQRIGLPLALGLVTIVPLTGWLLDRLLPGTPVRAGAMHLWFLWYVLLFYLCIPVLKRARRGSRGVARLLRSPVAVPLLAAFTVLLEYAAAHLPVNGLIWGAPEVVHWIVPLPGLVAFYGCFFVFGVLVQSGEGAALIGRRTRFNAVLALAALVPAVLLRKGPVWTGAGLPSDTPEGYAWAAAFSLLAWASCFTLWGLSERWLTRDRPTVRYVADSTYWIYLMHLPLAAVLVALIAPLPLPLPVSWLLVLAGLFGILIGLYELGVRHSAVGRVLNGARPPRGWRIPHPWRRRADRVPEGASG